MESVWTRLREPFPAKEIEWRAGPTDNKESPKKAIALAYLTARAVMNRLDEVLGPENWRDNYYPGPAGGVLCNLSVRLEDGEWISKQDAAENTDLEEVKGGISDAFKRAAVKYGIGRYLYDLSNEWVPCEKRGRSVVLLTTPDLPDWALPIDERGKPQEKAPTASQRISARQASAERVRKNVAEAQPEAKPVYPWAEELSEYMKAFPEVTGEIIEEVIGATPTWANIDAWLHIDEENTIKFMFDMGRWYLDSLREGQEVSEEDVSD